MSLAGKSIVVTGGNSGIGKAVVLAAAAQGANVVVDYRMHPEYAAEVVAAAGRAGGRAIGVEADVSRTEDLHRIIRAAVETFGRLDVLVSNAGIETRTSLLKQLNEAIPLGRITQAAEIADVVVFLASDNARYVNATTVTIDGGLSQSSVGL